MNLQIYERFVSEESSSDSDVNSSFSGDSSDAINLTQTQSRNVFSNEEEYKDGVLDISFSGEQLQMRNQGANTISSQMHTSLQNQLIEESKEPKMTAAVVVAQRGPQRRSERVSELSSQMLSSL